jgi:hypothetical protein
MSESELERSRRINARPNTEYKKVLELMEKYKKVLIEIANDYPELSQDKARMQNLDHIKWAKEALK